MESIIELGFIFLFGLVIGSFLNVVIYRVPRKLSVITPLRSYCPSCNRSLSSWENIPVVSWTLLGGKCRTCKQKISGQYPLVELLAGFAAVGTYLRFGCTPTGAVIVAVLFTLIAITFIDFEFKIIPNVISFPGMTLGLILGIVSQYTGIFTCPWSVDTCPVTQSAFDSLVGFLLGGGFFYAIGVAYLLIAKRVGLGGGDIKLMAMTGAILGWQSVAPTVFAGSLVGAVIGILTMLATGGGRQTEIPFGPYLSLGAVLYIFGEVPFFKFTM